MKSLALVIFSILLFHNIHAQCLSGSYVIGSDPSDDYPTIDLAVNDLVTQGMCSTVTFQIRNGIYTNTKVDIPEIIGNNSSNPLIIESLSGITSSTILSRQTSTLSSDNYVVSIKGIKYLTIKNLTIQRNSLSNNYATAIDISDTSNTLVFENLAISTPTYTFSSSTRNLVQSSAIIDTFQIDGTTFNGGHAGLYSWVGSFNNFSVNDCSFSFQYQYGIFTNGTFSNINISENDFNLQSNATSSNILNLYGASITITKNTFTHKDNAGSLAVSLSSQTAVQSSLNFSNNYITTAGNIYQMKGAAFTNFDSVTCYFNTIRTRGDNLNLTSNGYVNLRNNILDNRMINNSLVLQSNTNVISDYNCFNNAQQAPRTKVNGVQFLIFANYQNTIGFDNNSIVHAPNYIVDYHLADVVLDSAGIGIPTINEDLEGNLRGTPPDIGADEFIPPAVEAKLINFADLEVDMCPGNTPLYCKVVNLGLNVIDSIYFHFNVNGSFYSNHLWTGALNTLDTVSIHFADFDFTDLSTYQFQLTIDSVNNQLDFTASDNVISVSNIQTRMQGSYIIGYQQGDFEYMVHALEELQDRKTCGTVSFEFEDALHSFVDDPWTTTLPFALSNINEDSVIFRPQNPPVNGEYRAAVRFFELETYNCSKLFFEDLVFHDSKFDITWSDSIYFSRNFFQGDSSGFNYYLGTSAINVGNSEDLFMVKNTFVHGSSSIDLQQTQRVVIDSCIFKDVASQAIHAANSGSLFITNNLFDLSASTTDECIFLYTIGYFEITGNQFFAKNAPALEVYLVPSASSAPRLFANNSVTIDNAPAIDWDGFHRLKMVHNNFLVKGSTPNSIVHFETGYSNLSLYIEHNVFKNISGGRFFSGYMPVGGYLNYNAYDILNTTFHTSALNFSNWSAQGLDVLSTLSSIEYVSHNDLHLQNYSMPLIGNDTIHIERDLDNRLRLSPPSIGAYELRIDSLEIELLTLGLPSGICGEEPQYDLFFTNTGVDTLFQGNFQCIINGNDSVSIEWSGVVGNGDTSVVHFGILENLWEGSDTVQFYFSPDPYQKQTNLINDTINFNYAGTPMSGYYAVGGSSPDFAGLQNAIDALNIRGVCDSVFLDIQPGTIVSTVDLLSLEGPSIFLFSNIEGLENGHLWIGSTASTPAEIALRIEIDSNENITLENIGFYTNLYFAGINWIALNAVPYQNLAGFGGYSTKIAQSQNITIKSCLFQNGTADAIAILDNSHDITIDQNRFISCGFAVRSLQANDSVTGVTISNNHAEMLPYYNPSGNLSLGAAVINAPQNTQILGLYYLPNIDNLTIKNNTNISSTPYSVHIHNCQSNDPGCKKYGLEISNNQFKGTCLLENVHGTDSSRINIYNNFFAAITSTLVYDSGIEITGTYVNFYHNTIKSAGTPVYFDQIGAPGGPTFRMEKNLFINGSNPYIFWPFNSFSVFEFADNNAFASTPPVFGNLENNSIIYTPPIVNNFDLHISGGVPPTSLNNVLTTSYDIDYEGRGMYTTYGADEFAGVSLDLATSDLLTVANSCNDSVKVYGIISNEGTSVVNDYTLEFIWDAQPSTQFSFSSVGMGSQAFDTIYLGNYHVAVGNNYDFELHITQVNTITDNVSSNDHLLSNYTNPNVYTQLSATICDGDTIFIGNNPVFLSGLYVDSLTNSFGCDSLLQYDVTVNPLQTSTNDLTICAGDSVFLENAYRLTSGIFIDTILSISTCNSVVITNLTVDTFLASMNAVSICEGDSLLIFNTYQNTSGTYISDTLISTAGCDSLAYINLTVNTIQTVNTNASICAGDSLLIGGNYQTTSGQYQDTMPSSLGCDSIVIINLSVSPPIFSTLDSSICAGNSIMLNGNVYSTSGIYDVVFQSVSGCDSTVILNLAVSPPIYSTLDSSICAGSSIMLNGNVYSTSGIYDVVYQSVSGCDSTVQLTLDVHQVDVSVVNNPPTLSASNTNATSYQWVDCQTNFSPIANETDIELTPTANGNYAVIITETTCVDTSSCYLISNVGVDHETMENNLLIIPNPTTGEVVITMKYSTEATIEIVDAQGKLLNTLDVLNGEKISLANYEMGVYYLRITTDKGSYIAPVMKH